VSGREVWRWRVAKKQFVGEGRGLQMWGGQPYDTIASPYCEFFFWKSLKAPENKDLFQKRPANVVHSDSPRMVGLPDSLYIYDKTHNDA